MKKRFLSILLSLCMIVGMLPVTTLAVEEPAPSDTVSYTISEDGKTLTFSGSGPIGTDIIKKLWTEKTSEDESVVNIIEKVVVGEGITGLSGYSDYSSFLPRNANVNMTIEGAGTFRFAKYSCKDLTVSLTAENRTGIEIESSAFEGATLTAFPMEKLTAIGSRGFSNARLPMDGTTLELTLIGVDNSFDSLYENTHVEAFAFSNSMNADGDYFTSVDITVSGNIAMGAYRYSGANIFGNQITSAIFHLAEDTNFVVHQGFGTNSNSTNPSFKLERLTFTGKGKVYFQHPKNETVSDWKFDGNPFNNTPSLATIDFQEFSGEIQFANNMFNSGTGKPAAAVAPKLKEVLLGENCVVTRIGNNAFNFCQELTTFDFSKVKGPIGERAFQLTNLTGAFDLSGVTAIGQRAFEDVNADWENTIFPQDLKNVKMELSQLNPSVGVYKNPFLKNERVWEYVKAVLAGKFSLNQDGGYAALNPSENGWADNKYGANNATDAASTQMTKSAKWTDADRTTAEVEIQAAYAPDKQMDFIFVLDTSDSMRSVSTDDADMGKGYELISKTSDVVYSLLTSEDVDSRVSLIAFGTKINSDFGTFQKATHAADAVAEIRDLKFAGDTNYALALEEALPYVRTAQRDNRNVSVVFLSDGQANTDTDKIITAAKNITDLGVEIIGVFYGSTFSETAKSYMDQACTTYYQAEDTEGFSDAINRTIYDAFRTYTLTDKIGEDFQPVSADAISVTGGTVTLGADGRTITWDLSGTEPYQTYSMTIRQALTPEANNTYKEGVFKTNSGDALLTSKKEGTAVNQVASPELSRNTTGDLTVTKTVAGDSGDKTKDFNFTVILNDKTISGNFGEMEFKDGVANFSLKHGVSKRATGIPAGITYTVTEIEANQDGYTTTSTGTSGEIAEGQMATAAFTNTKNSGGDDGSGSGSGNTGSTDYILHYVSNGGTKYKDEWYTKNTLVQLNKVPIREGYTFTGWYADKGLAKRITEIKMTSDKTVYAGWEPTGVPDWLNGEDHFAYIIGYADGTVRPLENISRAEVATIFFRLLKADVRESYLMTESPFTDVNGEMWCNTAIATMAKMGVLKGRSAETFDPDAPITRAEFAAICARFDTSKQEGDSNFTDIGGHWAEEEIERAAVLGWIYGYTDGTFRPEQPISRAEAITMINRVLNRLPEDESDLLDGMRSWPDNPIDAWHYLAVQEATNSHIFHRKADGLHESWEELVSDPDWTQYQ